MSQAKGYAVRTLLISAIVASCPATAFVPLVAAAWIPTASADVIVAPQIVTTFPKQDVTVPALQFVIYSVGNLDQGEAVGVQIEVSNAVYNDLSAYVVDAGNMALARQNLPFRYLDGATKKIAPFRLMAKIDIAGPHYVVLDNRFAQVINKKVVYQLAMVKHLSDQEIQKLKNPLEQGYSAMKKLFVFKDFNINVKSCGQVNAYSTTATGDVTLCSELLDQMSGGTILAVFFHELGHTLLNLWGYPNFGNEDDADQFATIMLLKSGDAGTQALYEWIKSYAEHDSRAQARRMLVSGDTHSLSIQRIRNIQSWMANRADLMPRWNTVLYPNMTDWALNGIVTKPASFDDAEAAKRELARRQR